MNAMQKEEYGMKDPGAVLADLIESMEKCHTDTNAMILPADSYDIEIQISEKNMRSIRERCYYKRWTENTGDYVDFEVADCWIYSRGKWIEYTKFPSWVQEKIDKRLEEIYAEKWEYEKLYPEPD